MPARNVLRLVLDTNVWLDWLVFDDPAVHPVSRAHAQGRVQLFIDEPCSAELVRVLAYDLKKHNLDPAAQAACVAQCRRLANLVKNDLSDAERASLPRCRDPDDQKFLDLALVAGADALLTKDRALLELARRRARPAPFRIVNPSGFEELVR